MDSLDQYIQGVVTKEIYEPENYIRTIQNSLDTNDRHHKYFNLYKVAIIVICLLCTSGIAYATYNYVKNNFNHRKGIETAINNGYIMNVDGEPITSNDVSLKINQILLDDYNLDISFNLEFKNMEIPDNVQLIKFENIIITDENNTILYHSRSKDFFDNFIRTNNLNVEYRKYSDNYINSNSSNKSNCTNSNNYNLVYNISANNGTFPKSNSLHIYIENVVLCTDNDNSVINTNWNLTSSLSSSFQNRDTVNYTSVSNEDNDIVSVTATTYTTGTDIRLEMKVLNDEIDAKKLKELIEKAINEQNYNSVQVIDSNNGNDIVETENKLYNMRNNFHNIISDIYIETSFGQRFYITDNISINENFNITYSNKNIVYSNTIDMTTYNCTSNIKLHFNYNSKEYSINLICSD